MTQSRSLSCLFMKNSSCLISPRDTAWALVLPLLFSCAFHTFSKTPPDFRCRLLPLLIVKCPPLGSILVSLNSDAFGTDVGGGIVLGIVIRLAIPIRDGLCCHPQESAPPTIIDNVGSFSLLVFVRSSIITLPSNSHKGWLSMMGVSRAVSVSKNAAFLAAGWT
jgi:hypothetical protein